MKAQNKNNEKQPEVELLLQQVSLTMSKKTSFGQPANSALDISEGYFGASVSSGEAERLDLHQINLFVDL